MKPAIEAYDQYFAAVVTGLLGRSVNSISDLVSEADAIAHEMLKQRCIRWSKVIIDNGNIDYKVD